MPSNFAGRIAETAARLPDRVAIERLTSRGIETTTYRALLENAARRAGWLTTHGFARGDRAALLADNSAEWIAAYLGTLWLGGVAVPLDTAYKAGQIQTVIDSSGARVLFTTTRYLDAAQAARAGLADPDAVTLVVLDAEASGLTGPEKLAAATPVPQPTEVDSVDAAVMLYTSGTTADPKGVVLTHANLDAERAAVLAIIEASERDAILGVLPLFHALAQMANLLLPLAVGARVVFLETVSSTTLIEALTGRGITIFACVPQFFYLIHQRVTAEVAKGGAWRIGIFRGLLAANRMLRDRMSWNPGRRWFARVHARLGPTIRFLITGGSRFDETIGRDLYAMGFTILNAYGLTETSGAAAVQRPNDRFTTSVGQPLPGVTLRIAQADAEGSAKADHEPGEGEVLIRGPIIMREYYRRPDATAESLDDDGWLHTGDLGRLDEAGRLYITGRQKDIIVLSSGKNLYPEEIEAHYRQSPLVGELCVMGLTRPGEPAAERLYALIVPNAEVLRTRGIVNVGDAIRFEVETWSASLPAHKRILSYGISTDPLPRTTTGKLKRHEITRLARARTDSNAARAGRATDTMTAEERDWRNEPQTRPLVDLLAERLGRPVVHPADNLELDLGLDSMERVELLTHLERHAHTNVAPPVRATIFTVRQLVDAVLAGTPAETASEAEPEPAWSAILNAPGDPALERQLARSRLIGSWVSLVVVRLALLVARLVVRVRVTDRGRIPSGTACLICPNHQTFFDGFLVAATVPAAVLEHMFFVGAAEYFEGRSGRWFARLINLVPIDPDAHLVDAMRAGAVGLRQGKILLLFPEGERTIDGEVKRFRKGAAILAEAVDAAIVPVALSGLFPIWPRGRSIQWRTLWPPRRRLITVTFGAPIRVHAGDDADTMEQVRQVVTGLLGQQAG